MKKNFDCVEMKNDIQKRLYERRKQMTHAEEMQDIESRLAGSQSPAWWRKTSKKASQPGSVPSLSK
jgi:hypothetical protein